VTVNPTQPSVAMQTRETGRSLSEQKTRRNSYRRCSIYRETQERKRLEFIDRYHRATRTAGNDHLDICAILKTLKFLSSGTETKLPRWENASLGLRNYYAIRAIQYLKLTGYTFTINLSDERAKKANEHHEGSSRHLYREIYLKLQRALGRAPALFFCQETLGTLMRTNSSIFKPHLHGCIGLLDEAELAAVRKVMNSVARGYRSPQTAVKIERLRDSGRVNWSIYCLKQIWLTPFRTTGSPSACSQILIRTGKELYERDVAGMTAAGLIGAVIPNGSTPPVIH